MSKTTLTTIIIAIIVIAGGYFFLRESYQTPKPPQQETVTPPIDQELPFSPAASAAREIPISGSEFKFDPSSITTKAGERVKVTFKNDGKAIHNWTIEGLGVGTQTVNGGENDTVEFTSPAAGSYTLFCSVPGHRERGMVGTLKVE